MSEKHAADTSWARADALGRPSRGRVCLTPQDEQQAGALMSTAERLKQALVPVDPSAAFVRRLGRELVEAARRQQERGQRVRRGVVIGAAALGSALSVAGVVTLVLLRRRAHFRPRTASH
jgi:hypothetical protein